MGISEFIRGGASAATKGRSQAKSASGKAKVKDFDRDQLENAAASFTQNAGGFIDSALSNIGTLTRPAGTLGAAAIDSAFGDGATTEWTKNVRGVSKGVKESAGGKMLDFIARNMPSVGINPMEMAKGILDAPSGSSSNTWLGKALRENTKVFSGYDPEYENSYLTPKFKAAVNRADNESGFMETAQRIAENRGGQRQDNISEKIIKNTIGKVPKMGPVDIAAIAGYFDKDTPNIEDRAIEGGATPEQAAFISMLNGLEWLGAESKAEILAKLRGPGKIAAARRALNVMAQKVVDPLQYSLDKTFEVLSPASTKAAYEAALKEPATTYMPQRRPGHSLKASGDTGVQEFIRSAGHPSTEVADEMAMQFDAPVVEDVDGLKKNFAAFLGRDVNELAPELAPPASVVDNAPVSAIDEAVAPIDNAVPVEQVDELATPVDNALAQVDNAPIEQLDVAPVEVAAEQAVPPATTLDEHRIIGRRMLDESPELQAYELANEAAQTATSKKAIAKAEKALAKAEAAVPPDVMKAWDDWNSEAERLFNAEQSAPAAPTSVIDNALQPEQAIDNAIPGPADAVGSPPASVVDNAVPPGQAAVVEPSVAPPIEAIDNGISDVVDDVIPPPASAAEQLPPELKAKLDSLPLDQVKGLREKITKGQTVRDIVRLDSYIADREIGEAFQTPPVVAILEAQDAAKASRIAEEINVELDAFRSSLQAIQESSMPDKVKRQKAAAIREKIAKLEAKLAEATAPPVVATPAKKSGQKYVQLNMGLAFGPEFDAAMARVSDAFKSVLKRIKDSEARVTWTRFMSGVEVGKVPAEVVEQARNRLEDVDAYNRALSDAYHAVVNGDTRAILGNRGAVHGNLDKAQLTSVRDFIGHRTVNGQLVNEATLVSRGLPADVIAVAKLVRREMDATSDLLMSETFNLPRAWFNHLNDSERFIVSRLAETASKPKSRAKYMKALYKAIAADPTAPPLSFVQQASNYVDSGFARLNKAGVWLNGEDPVDMMLTWAPYLRNRGSYQPLLYRLFEHGITTKGSDAVELYLNALKDKGVTLPEEVINFLKISWMNADNAGSAKAGTDGARLMSRNPNIPNDVKELLQEIDDPAYAYAKGLYQVNRLTSLLNMRRWLASQSQFVSLPGEGREAFLARTGFRPEEVAVLDDTVLPQMQASGRALGAMKGRFIHQDMWDLAYQVHALPGIHQGGNDAWMKFNREIVQRWKFWHTVANPASHARQAGQNLLSIWLAGGWGTFRRIPEAIRQYSARGDLYKIGRKHGLLGASSLNDMAELITEKEWRFLKFNPAESFVATLGKFGESVAALSESFRVGDRNKIGSAKWAAKMWAYVDEVARLSLLKTLMDRGVSEADAVKAVKAEVYSGLGHARIDRLLAGVPLSSTYANPGSVKSGLNKSSLRAGAIQTASFVGQIFNLPFWGSARFIAEQTLRTLGGVRAGERAMLSDPARMGRALQLALLTYGAHHFMRNLDGLTPDEEVRQRADYQRGLMPMYQRIPTQLLQMIDDQGKVGYIDWSWLYPWGETVAGSFNPRTGRMEGTRWRDKLIQMSPIFKPPFEALFNTDLFRESVGLGPDIYRDLDPTSTKLRKSTAHIWRATLPPWAANPVFAVGDMLMSDGGEDGKWSPQELTFAFLQGVANDSGHLASKAASALYNSPDYYGRWYASHGGEIEKGLQVKDYAGRTQYLVKVLADALAIKITSYDLKTIDENRRKAQDKAVSNVKYWYSNQEKLTTNPEMKRRIREEMAAEIKTIRAGKPSKRWYDETPQDTYMNVLNYLASKTTAK